MSGHHRSRFTSLNSNTSGMQQMQKKLKFQHFSV